MEANQALHDWRGQRNLVPGNRAMRDRQEGVERFLSTRLDMEPALTRALGHGGYQLLGVLAFLGLGLLLFRTSMKAQVKVD